MLVHYEIGFFWIVKIHHSGIILIDCIKKRKNRPHGIKKIRDSDALKNIQAVMVHFHDHGCLIL